MTRGNKARFQIRSCSSAGSSLNLGKVDGMVKSAMKSFVVRVMLQAG
jgi:hypothetical protein